MKTFLQQREKGKWRSSPICESLPSSFWCINSGRTLSLLLNLFFRFSFQLNENSNNLDSQDLKLDWIKRTLPDWRWTYPRTSQKCKQLHIQSNKAGSLWRSGLAIDLVNKCLAYFLSSVGQLSSKGFLQRAKRVRVPMANVFFPVNSVSHFTSLLN